MKRLVAINGLNVLTGAVYAGFTFAQIDMPIWARIATVLFMAAVLNQVSTGLK